MGDFPGEQEPSNTSALCVETEAATFHGAFQAGLEQGSFSADGQGLSGVMGAFIPAGSG